MRTTRWSALALLTLSIWVAAPLVAADPPDPPAPDAVSTEAPPLHGSIGEVDGLPALFLHGDVQERGFTEGYLCAERIQQLFDGFVLETPLVPFPPVWDAVVRPMLLRRADPRLDAQPAPLSKIHVPCTKRDRNRRLGRG